MQWARQMKNGCFLIPEVKKVCNRQCSYQPQTKSRIILRICILNKHLVLVSRDFAIPTFTFFLVFHGLTHILKIPKIHLQNVGHILRKCMSGHTAKYRSACMPSWSNQNIFCPPVCLSVWRNLGHLGSSTGPSKNWDCRYPKGKDRKSVV